MRWTKVACAAALLWSIGGALATREIKSAIREAGGSTRGPAPLGPRERSRFSNALDRVCQRALRPR